MEAYFLTVMRDWERGLFFQGTPWLFNKGMYPRYAHGAGPMLDAGMTAMDKNLHLHFIHGNP